MKSRYCETLGVLALAAVTSPCAMAQDPHWYLGGNVGQSRSHFDEAAIARSLQGPALATTSIQSDDTDWGYKLFVGYQFHRNFALEGGYFDLGDFSFNTTTVPPGTLNGNLSVKGWNLDLVGILPFTERF
jgi:OOP family OmpA-OmpF porin